METIIYLIRHSKKFDMDHKINFIGERPNRQIITERNILSIEGEEKAKKIAKDEEFKNIDIVYSSLYSRAMSTAKYFLENNNLEYLNVDERLGERKWGEPDLIKHPNYMREQYEDENLKNDTGESSKEVRTRMHEAIKEIIDKNKGKRIIVVSHGAAITFLLMQWCKITYNEENKSKKIVFNDKIILNRKYREPEVFKLIIDEENKVKMIENIDLFEGEMNEKGK